MSSIFKVTKIDQPRVFEIAGTQVEAYPGSYLVSEFNDMPVEVISAVTLATDYLPMVSQPGAYYRIGYTIVDSADQEMVAAEIEALNPTTEVFTPIPAAEIVPSKIVEEVVVQPEPPTDTFRLNEEHADASEPGEAGEASPDPLEVQ